MEKCTTALPSDMVLKGMEIVKFIILVQFIHNGRIIAIFEPIRPRKIFLQKLLVEVESLLLQEIGQLDQFTIIFVEVEWNNWDETHQLGNGVRRAVIHQENIVRITISDDSQVLTQDSTNRLTRCSWLIWWIFAGDHSATLPVKSMSYKLSYFRVKILAYLWVEWTYC